MDTITGTADTTTDIHTTTRKITDTHMEILTTTHTTTRMDTIIHTRTGTHTDTIIMLPPRLRIHTTMAGILTTTTTTCTEFSYTLPQMLMGRWPSFSRLP